MPRLRPSSHRQGYLARSAIPVHRRAEVRLKSRDSAPDTSRELASSSALLLDSGRRGARAIAARMRIGAIVRAPARASDVYDFQPGSDLLVLPRLADLGGFGRCLVARFKPGSMAQGLRDAVRHAPGSP